MEKSFYTAMGGIKTLRLMLKVKLYEYSNFVFQNMEKDQDSLHFTVPL